MWYTIVTEGCHLEATRLDFHVMRRHLQADWILCADTSYYVIVSSYKR